MSWRQFPVSLKELCIDTTLRCGQSFRWKQSQPGVYSCALHGRLLSLRQDGTHLHYRAIYPPAAAAASPAADSVKLEPPASDDAPDPLAALPSSPHDDDDDTEALLRHYLHLDVDLAAQYRAWASADATFGRRAPRFAGVRVLRQPAWEALVGFVCSSNNNIARIALMLDRLCAYYGPLVGCLDGVPFHDLPPPEALVGPGVEAHLRELGFGYRARYLHETAILVAAHGGAQWLDALRNPARPAFYSPSLATGPAPAVKEEEKEGEWGEEEDEEMPEEGRAGYRAAHATLLALPGVGPKVADCVCLMGLGWGEAVPVDTHVWQIAQRDYGFGRGRRGGGGSGPRTLTKPLYDAVAAHFRRLWGVEAGWAHSVLFTADLRAFAGRAAGVEAGPLEAAAEDEQATLVGTVAVKAEEAEGGDRGVGAEVDAEGAGRADELLVRAPVAVPLTPIKSEDRATSKTIKVEPRSAPPSDVKPPREPQDLADVQHPSIKAERAEGSPEPRAGWVRRSQRGHEQPNLPERPVAVKREMRASPPLGHSRPVKREAMAVRDHNTAPHTVAREVGTPVKVEAATAAAAAAVAAPMLPTPAATERSVKAERSSSPDGPRGQRARRAKRPREGAEPARRSSRRRVG